MDRKQLLEKIIAREAAMFIAVKALSLIHI